MNDPEGLVHEKAIFESCQYLREIHSRIMEPQGNILETEAIRGAEVLSGSMKS